MNRLRAVHGTLTLIVLCAADQEQIVTKEIQTNRWQQINDDTMIVTTEFDCVIKTHVRSGVSPGHCAYSLSSLLFTVYSPLSIVSISSQHPQPSCHCQPDWRIAGCQLPNSITNSQLHFTITRAGNWKYNTVNSQWWLLLHTNRHPSCLQHH